MPNRMVNSSQLDIVFRALADPTRRSILEQLTDGTSKVAALAEPHSMEGHMGMPDTVTDVQLREVDGGTELTLLVTGLRDETMQGMVSEGWSSGMDKLGEVLQSLKESL